jgi:hypothetical protein
MKYNIGETGALLTANVEASSFHETIYEADILLGQFMAICLSKRSFTVASQLSLTR